jgi:hypothetical protein
VGHAKDVLNLDYFSKLNSINVVKRLGQQIISKKINSKTTVDMSSLTKGVYIITVTSGSNVQSRKVVK